MATVNTAELLSHQPSSATRTLSLSTNGVSRPARNTAPTAPRLDMQPLYTTLKEMVGDKWQRYIAIVAEFLLGGRNHAELTRELDHILQHDPAKEHAHNQMVCAIMYNSTRDPPEPGVAPWVSANDKPATSTKPVSGDVAEQRLKAEIMDLPPRDRHRIKSIQDEAIDELASRYKEAHAAATVRPPEVVGASAGGFNKTNWELEIRKRYAQALFSESNEFPDLDTIQARMVPICYELGVGGGASAGSAEYLNLAAETYVKKVLGEVFGAIWANGEGYIKTAAYKRRLEREETLWLRQDGGGVVRDAAGLLPVEIEAAEGRKPLDMSDLRLALRTADGYAQQNPLTAVRVVEGWNGTASDWYDDEDANATNGDGGASGRLLNAKSKLNAGRGGGKADEEMDLDAVPSDHGWAGGGIADQDALGTLLDDCLGV